MFDEDVKIDFAGFEPTQDVRSALYFILNKLQLKSPSKSFLRVTFTLTNGIFHGVVTVASQAGNFVANATDVQLTAVGQKLSDRLMAKLEKWKSLRFE